ncbi:ABC transporter permease [Leucobacter sp. NPDC077196]|uniref:ABC transporter permease n=1 Tax=Leucobacter sp. NPDC077196 TaxID=3154959 RepID=UPI0034363545
MTEHPALRDPEYSTPGTSLGLISVFRYHYLLGLLLKKGVVTRYYGSVLGWAWSYIRPLAQFFMYYVVIGILLGVSRGVEYFPIYLFSGIIVINLFSETFRATTDAVLGNKALIRKVYLPRELFPVAAAGGAIIHFLPQAVVLFIVCLFNGWHFTWMQPLAFVLSMIIVVLFALGLGLFFGALNVLYRDSKNFVDLILMFATWSSPVLYTFEKVRDRAPDWLYHLYMANPVTTAVELSHSTFWAPIASDAARPGGLMMNSAIGIGLAIVALLIGQLVFRKKEGQFAQNL